VDEIPHGVWSLFLPVPLSLPSSSSLILAGVDIRVQFSGEKTEKQDGNKCVLEVTSRAIDILGDHYENFEMGLSLHPIFIPSKNWAMKKHANLLINGTGQVDPKLLEPTTRAVIVLVVEAPYLNDRGILDYIDVYGYLREANKFQKFLFAEIPPKDRGVGFSRTCIASLIQPGLNKLLSKYKRQAFDFFYMIDDDVQNVSFYDRLKFEMVPCTIPFMLSGVHRIMTHELAQLDIRKNALLSLIGDQLEPNVMDYISKFETLINELE
jgi:hypothetical protein